MISQTILLANQPLQPAVLETIQAILSEQLPGSQLIHETIAGINQADWEVNLRQLADHQGVLLILTVGGIGPTGCVPDATMAVCPKLFPGFGTILRHVAPLGPAALLWRNTAGLRNQTLIVNLPNSLEAIQTGLPLLFPAIPNAIRLAKG
jgi:molybdopterin adenylyltransferase